MPHRVLETVSPTSRSPDKRTYKFTAPNIALALAITAAFSKMDRADVAGFVCLAAEYPSLASFQEVLSGFPDIPNAQEVVDQLLQLRDAVSWIRRRWGEYNCHTSSITAFLLDDYCTSFLSSYDSVQMFQVLQRSTLYGAQEVLPAVETRPPKPAASPARIATSDRPAPPGSTRSLRPISHRQQPPSRVFSSAAIRRPTTIAPPKADANSPSSTALFHSVIVYN